MAKPSSVHPSSASGLIDLGRIILRHWIWILGLALVLGLVGFLRATSEATTYRSTAQILVQSPSDAKPQNDVATLYRVFLQSDRVLQRASEKLTERGLVPEGTTLVFGRDVFVRVQTPSDPRRPPTAVILSLTARAQDPDVASEMANSWAQASIEESEAVLRVEESEVETLLAPEIERILEETSELEAKKVDLSNQFEKEEVQLKASWDRRLAAARVQEAKKVQEHHEETLRQMNGLVDARVEGLSSEEKDRLRRDLADIVAAYWQLARTPRLLRLEKAASDDTAVDLLALGRIEDSLENTVTTEEVNPLYDLFAAELSRRVRDLERDSTDRGSIVLKMVMDLDRLLLTRSTDLQQLDANQEGNLRALKRQEALDLRALSRERAEAQRETLRRIEDLNGLATRLQDELTKVKIAGLLQDTASVDLLAPASLATSDPRTWAVETVSWGFLGGLLGLCIALFLSFRSWNRGGEATRTA